LVELSQPQVVFNYLGQFDQLADQGSVFKPVNDLTGNERSQNALRPQLLDISGSVKNSKLVINIIYSSNIHNEKTISNLLENYMQALRDIIEHCSSDSVGGLTSSDIVGAGISEDEMDDIISELDFE